VDKTLIFSILGLLISAGGLWMALDARRYSRRQTDTAKFEELGREVALLKMQVGVFWKGVSFSASQALHSPHTPELDELIERFQQGTITDTELRKFKSMLAKIKESDEDKIRQKFASDVLTLIHIRYEITPEMVAQFG
jgi:hypothetical protein